MRLVLRKTEKREGSVRMLFSVLMVAAVLASLLCVGALPVPTQAAADWPAASESPLAAGDGAGGDFFGASVAIDGDTAVVGAKYDDVGATMAQGSAYVFLRSGPTWSQEAQLFASDGAEVDYFGCSVAISGDTAVVGARNADVGGNSSQGSAYVFVRNGSTWFQQSKLTAGDGAVNDYFGDSVAISGDTVVVGAYQDDVGANSGQGSAYVYLRSGASWSQQAKLTASDGAASDFFGSSVAVDGDTAVIGAHYDDIGASSDQGSAYVFARSGTSWGQQAKLTASDGVASDFFGNSVAVDGDITIVGAQEDDVGANGNQGSAYVFVRSGTAWGQETKLTAGDGAAGDAFGSSVAINGDTVVAGAELGDAGGNGNTGSAYVFLRNGAAWGEQAKLTASDGASMDRFGSSVAVYGDTAIAGASESDVGGNSEQGAAYVYQAGLGDTGDGCQVTATVTLQSISVSISEGYPTAVGYGAVAPGAEAVPVNYIPGEYENLRVFNSGSMVEDLLIKGADATYGRLGIWTLATKAGADQYAHFWGVGMKPATYSPLSTAASTLGADVPVGGTVDFNLKIQTPTSSTYWGQYSTAVSIIAVAA